MFFRCGDEIWYYYSYSRGADPPRSGWRARWGLEVGVEPAPTVLPRPPPEDEGEGNAQDEAEREEEQEEEVGDGASVEGTVQ